MPERGPVLFASYAGLLGGAERVLLDAAVRLERPVVVACPEGPLAERVRAGGVAHAELTRRGLELGAAHAAGLAGLAQELTRLARRHRPAALVAWGARAVLAAALIPRRPPLLAVHHDLLARGAVRRAAAAASRRAGGGAAPAGGVAPGAGPGGGAG